MSHPYFARGPLRFAACVAIVLASAAPAAAAKHHHRRAHHHAAPAPAPAPMAVPELQPTAPGDTACTDILKNALASEGSGQLQGAADLFRSCARASCAPFVRDQCVTHFKTLENDVPTVVLMVSDATGASRTDVEVRVDGSVFSPQIDGRPLAIDPGMHDFSFAIGQRVFAAGKVMILQGQRNRFITVLMDASGGGHLASEREQAAVETHSAPPPRSAASVASASNEKESEPAAAPAAHETESAAAASDKEDSSSGEVGLTAAAEPARTGKHRLAPLLIGGLGLASIGAGALLTTWGRKDNDTLLACAPNCSPAAVNHIRRVYYEADAAIGVGIAALVAAYMVYAINHDSSSGEATHEQALRLDISPTRAGGGVASVSGRF